MGTNHDAPREPAPGASRSPKVILGVMAVLLVGGTAAVVGWLTAQQRLGADVARLARTGDIRMIASQDCNVCHIARQWFDEHRVAFSECTIERDPQCRAQFDALRAQGTPVLLVRGQPVMGFEPHRVRQLLGG
ncbi:MAG: glutaredoxin family protein [Pseudomonadota bacterium]